MGKILRGPICRPITQIITDLSDIYRCDFLATDFTDLNKVV